VDSLAVQDNKLNVCSEGEDDITCRCGPSIGLKEGASAPQRENWPDGASKIVRLPVSDGGVLGIGDI